VVTQFLGYARPDRGDRQSLNINDVVNRTIQLLRPQATEEAQIKINLSPDLPQVMADPEQLRQVFLNLGINSLQAMERGGTLFVSTRLRRGSKGGELISFVEVSFRDTGMGIPQETLSNLFIPFFTTKESGTGLGLPICQRIVENHKGLIEVRSQLNKGSVFSVLLPSAEDITSTHKLQTDRV
jgi:signal transduction histidine kinase